MNSATLEAPPLLKEASLNIEFKSDYFCHIDTVILILFEKMVISDLNKASTNTFSKIKGMSCIENFRPERIKLLNVC